MCGRTPSAGPGPGPFRRPRLVLRRRPAGAASVPPLLVHSERRRPSAETPFSWGNVIVRRPCAEGAAQSSQRRALGVQPSSSTSRLCSSDDIESTKRALSF
jgi:hypothetical protein